MIGQDFFFGRYRRNSSAPRLQRLFSPSQRGCGTFRSGAAAQGAVGEAVEDGEGRGQGGAALTDLFFASPTLLSDPKRPFLSIQSTQLGGLDKNGGGGRAKAREWAVVVGGEKRSGVSEKGRVQKHFSLLPTPPHFSLPLPYPPLPLPCCCYRMRCGCTPALPRTLHGRDARGEAMAFGGVGAFIPQLSRISSDDLLA